MPFDSASIESSIDTYPSIHDGENDDLYNSDYDSDDGDYDDDNGSEDMESGDEIIPNNEILLCWILFNFVSNTAPVQ